MKYIFKGIQKNKSGWEHFAWEFNINGQIIEYKTGLGHATKVKDSFVAIKPKNLQKKTIKITHNGQVLFVHVPKLRHILNSLVTDYSCAQDSFEDFCSNFGYDTDSRSALETYLACQESGTKLRKIMKSKNYIERIQAWEL